MKLEQFLLPVAAAFAFSLAGCGKQDTTATTEDMQKTAPPVAQDAQKAAAPAADAMKQTTDSAKAAAETVAAEAPKAADVATGNVQEWIDKAKNLVAENKFSEAASVLQQLAGQPLTAEQQKLVDGLKEQIQKALETKATGEGASAVGNLLKK
jgi:hypothetical protein